MAHSGTGNPIVTAALAELAALRQATGVDEETLDLFSARIAEDGLDVELVVDACRELSRMERAEGESAFPSYGTLLREYHAAEYRRHVRRQKELAAEGAQYLLPGEEVDRPEWTPQQARLLIANFREAVEAKRRRRGA